MNLTVLLEKAIEKIETVVNYYDAQSEYINSKTKNVGEKYKYSLALNRYFMEIVFKKNHPERKIKKPLTDNEREMVESIIDDYTIINDDKMVKIQYKLNKCTKELEKSYELQPLKGLKEYRKISAQPRILGNTTIMMLLIEYENAITDIFRYLMSEYPKAYLDSKTITYTELISFDSSMSELKNYFINNEVEEIMRSPLMNWYKLLDDKHKCRFDFRNGEFEQFKEIYYRRNVIVHNDCIVNKVYLDNVSNTCTNGAKIGDVLHTSEDYFRKAIGITQIVIYATFWGLRKIADNLDSICDKLFNIGFEHMIQEEWELSEFIFSSLMNEKSQSESTLLCTKVNYWISIKNRIGLDSIEKDIKNLDVSAMSGEFVVAKHALLNEHSDVSEKLNSLINVLVSVHSIETWPLFKQYRESEEYTSFRKKHRRKFELKTYEPDDTN